MSLSLKETQPCLLNVNLRNIHVTYPYTYICTSSCRVTKAPRRMSNFKIGHVAMSVLVVNTHNMTAGDRA